MCCGHLLFALYVWAASHLDLCLVLRYLLELMPHKTRQLSSPLFRITKWTFSKLPNFFKTKNDWQLILIMLKKKTTAHRRCTHYHVSPRVKPKQFKTYPPGVASSSLSSTQNFYCWHHHQLPAAPPERKSILACCGRTPIPERTGPSVVSLFEAQCPCPGELCPCAARGHGTRTIHSAPRWRGRRVRSQTVGCARNPTWNMQPPASSVSSERVQRSRSRSVTSFARQQPVNRRLLSPPAVNSW